MRMALLAVLALAAFSLATTGADAGAWCPTYSGALRIAAIPGLTNARRILPTESTSQDGLTKWPFEWTSVRPA